MGQRITIVDSFTDTPFAGNPAGVCVLAEPTTDAWMQAVAAELNLSETAFVVARDDGDDDLRWFTPTTEIDLCGHATLASAHVLGGERRFHTRSGVLICRPTDDGAIALDFPASPPVPVADPPDWGPALGVKPDRVLGVWSTPTGWTLVELAAAADVRGATPDLAGILALGGHMVAAVATGDRPGVDSVVRVFAPAIGVDEDPVTGAVHCVLAPWRADRTGGERFTGEQASARGGLVGMQLAGDRPGVDSVVRVFAPAIGVDEDPVTGAVHCVLAPWRADRTGGERFTGEQASARGGLVGMQLAGDRVVLSGHAVTVIDGTLHSDPPPVS